MKKIIFILLFASICFGQTDSTGIVSSGGDSSFWFAKIKTTKDTTMVWAVVAKNYEVVSIAHHWEEAYYGPRQVSTPISLCVFEQIYKVETNNNFTVVGENIDYYTQNWKKVIPVIVFDYHERTFWHIPTIDTVRYETKY
jgi:hypothetical protein